MKFLSTKVARAVWLFPTVDVDPAGKFVPSVIASLAERYKFAKAPDVAAAHAVKEGLKFEYGVFSRGAQGEVMVQFTIFSDGVVADTQVDTTTSEHFIEDVVSWLIKDHKFIRPKKPRKQYGSEIYVEVNDPFRGLRDKLKKPREVLSRHFKDLGAVSYDVFGIHLAAEPVGPLSPPPFRFERAAGVPFADNRYWSLAPLQTQDHLKVLEEFEAALVF